MIEAVSYFFGLFPQMLVVKLLLVAEECY